MHVLKRLVPIQVRRALYNAIVAPHVRAAERRVEEKHAEERRRAEAKRRRDDRAPRWSRSERRGPKDTIGVGFAGAGQYARYHLEALSSYEAVEIPAMLTTGGAAAATVAPQFGIEHLFTDIDAFVAQDVDCFVVVVPPRVVVEVASRCLATGKPVLLEKPPGVTSADTEALIRTAENAGTWGMVGMNRRFNSLVEHGLAALADMGPIRGAMLEVPQRFTEDRQSGRLSEFDYEHFYVRNSIHGVDLLRYVLGDPVRVHSLTWPNTEFHNRASSYAAILDYGGGVMATILDLWDTPAGLRLKIVAEKRAVVIEPTRRGWVERRGGRSYPITFDQVDVDFRPGVWAQDLHFVEAVRAGRKPSVPASTLQDSLGTMILMEQILASSLGAAVTEQSVYVGAAPAHAIRA